MKLYLVNHNYRYAVEQIMTVLFPSHKPQYSDTLAAEQQDTCHSTLTIENGTATAQTVLHIGGQSSTGTATLAAPAENDDALERDRVLQRVIKQSFYRAALPLLPEAPAWGALTGIRPAKLASKALQAGLTEQQTAERFRNTYFVSESRTHLAIEVAKCSIAAKNSLKPDEISLYIGIPFCPTRCAYCSFVSADVKRALTMVDPFLTALHREIDQTAFLLQQAGVKVRTIYIGGGTPTTLSAQQMDALLTHVRQALDLSRLTEFTVEAGRPDTITAEKMAVLKAQGVDRVSVNPQSMRDEVLQAMGRAHTAADIVTAYRTVRDAGIAAINMDLIAGLPRDTVEGFRYTLDSVLDLDPENITVHTLALKKGSRLIMERQGLPSGAQTSAMLDYAWSELFKTGYIPYYLYRQKYMTGALENIGWCKPSFEGLYNICIMEELHTILALGAGGSTKLTDPASGRIVRITNPKYPKEYIERIGQICAEKHLFVHFHQNLQ